MTLCRCLDGHVKELYEMSRWKPDCRFNFFFNPPAHLCAVTYVTEISLNNQFTSPNLDHPTRHGLQVTSPRLKECALAVTYMTEILLHVTLSNQSHSHTPTTKTKNSKLIKYTFNYSWTSGPVWDLHMFYLLRPILFPTLS